jgi:hypothetical protein
MEKTLLLYTYVDGGINDTPFPNAEDQIEIGAFRYNATRMGAAPTITATVMHPTCLDNVWTSKVYAKFNGEKFYLKQTPTSSFDNEDSRYKHSVEFVSERVILDNVYFYDAVKPGDSNVDDRPVSNSTKFVFYGDIYDFANRLSSSLKFSGLDYTVIVDDGITSEEKLVSFEDTFFSNAIQEAYNTYEVPYYFVGKEIHFGDSNSALPETLKYGVDNQLISITKTNKNLKIVNRITGRGSTENIPYYYPNDSPKGEIKAVASSGLSVKIIDAELFSSKINVGEPLTFKKASPSVYSIAYSKNGTSNTSYSSGYVPISLTNSSPMSMWWILTINVSGTGDVEIGGEFNVEGRSSISFANVVKSATLKSQNGERKLVVSKGKVICSGISSGTHTITLGCTFSYIGTDKYNIKPSITLSGSGSWYLHNGKSTKLSKVGLELVSGTPSNGSTIEQQIGKYVNTSQNLMPSIYRETDGAERFYNAINGEYGDVYFRNPFVEGQPKEHIVNFEDIKPTIKEATNDAGQRIDMFADFAYDEPDSDETYEDTEDNSNVKYKHGYFFAKLRKLPFNLFDHAIENQPMTISFTSGSCGSCKFKIGVTEEYPQRNPVQVDENGNLVRDDQGRVVCGVHGDVKTFQDSQQDTSKGEVWIALMKEEETYGILMPKAPTDTTVGHRPLPCTKHTHDDGDTFVITGIHLPKEYILAAEDKLKDKLIEYMADNNREKFSFAIKFSRIYFEENQRILEFLNENSQIDIAYDKDENGEDIVYTQFVKSFSYSMSEGDILPDITVELDENLTVGQNAIQNAISEVRSEIRNVENSVQAAAMMQSRSFINKQTDDTALGEVSFEKGAKFGDESNVAVLGDRTAKLTIDYLEVKKKATFTSLEIQEKTHVGGQLVISPAAMTCNRVEEIEGGYRCYFQTQGEDGEEVFNQFVKEDLAICQTFNSWGSRYYWRKVVNVGDDYIDLSNIDGEYDDGSDIPMAGDKIVQLGNTSDTTRQAAQILSAHGDGSPSFVMYNGIDGFSLKDKNITGIIWNPATQEPQMYSYGSFYFGDRKLAGNYITFQKKDGSEEKEVHINARITVGEGSDGLSNLSEWQQAEEDIENAKNTAQDALDAAQQALADMSLLDEGITEINKRLDGVVENYFYEGAPSMSNVPVSDWMQSETSKEFFNHVGDTYTDIQEYMDDESTPTAGKSWRWCMCGEQDIETVETETYSLQSSSWTKIGNVPIKDYGSFRIRVTGSYRTYSSNFSYDEDIRVYSGPPTYVRVEKATGDVYVLDENRFIQGQMSVLFYVGAVLVFDYNGLDTILHWHPIADSDAVKALLEASKAQSTADGKSTTYLSKPTNGYKKGDLWILESDSVHSQGQKGDILTANQDSTSYIASHWKKVVRYTDDSALEDFIDGDFKNTIDSINTQIDKKAETWYQSTDPSTSWKTDAVKKEHIGDMWYDTDDGVTQRWNGTSWQKQDIPDEVFDKIDGKKSIYTSQPSSYSVNDLWILEKTYILSGVSYTKGELVVAKQTSSSFNASHWEKKVKYTDDTIANAAKELAQEAKGIADGASSTATSAQELANNANTLAGQAQGAAEQAQALVDAANKSVKEAQEAAAAAEASSKASEEAAQVAKKAAEDGQITVGEYQQIAEEAQEAADAASKAAKEADDAAKAADDAAKAAQALADEAASDAANAAASASQAASDAKSASDRLDEWANDELVSPSDIPAIESELVYIAADKADIDAQLAIYEITNEQTVSSAFNESYTSYKTALENVLKLTIGSAFPTDVDTKQNDYYTKRTAILGAIATAAKKVADDAQDAADDAKDVADGAKETADSAKENANKAKEAADKAAQDAAQAKADASTAKSDAATAKIAAAAAKQATDDLDADLKFTLVEKRSIRKMLKDINPSEKGSVSTTIWQTGTRTAVSGTNLVVTPWTKILDEEDQDYGWYQSNMHTASKASITKIPFTVNRECDITVQIKARSESYHDYVLLSELDATLASNLIYNSSGVVKSTYGTSAGQIVSYNYEKVPVGTHFITVMYRKDSDTDVAPDNGYYRFMSESMAKDTVDSVFEIGSLGDWYRIMHKKGIGSSEMQIPVTNAASLFSYLNGIGKVWEDNTTDVPEGFRDAVYNNFQKYYASISDVLVKTSTSDLDYLANAMKNGKTITDGGLVMTSIVAVGDTATTDTNVEAFLNGSSFARDETHGKLILASGIPEATSEDVEDLEVRAKEATTRIYEDGHIETRDIKAVGGEFDEVLINGSTKSPFVLWRKYDITDSSSGLLYHRYPAGDANGRYAWIYYNATGTYSTRYTAIEIPYNGCALYGSSTGSQLAVAINCTPINVFDGNDNNKTKHDNIVLPKTGAPSSSSEAVSSGYDISAEDFSWGAENSGRLIRLNNYKWGSTIAYGNTIIKAPSGKYFFENGRQHSQLMISRECIELLGYGTEHTFYGWIVMSRQNVVTVGKYGMPLEVLYQGVFVCQSPYLQRLWSSEIVTTGLSEPGWGVKILDTNGKYRIYLPMYFSDVSNFHVMLTPQVITISGGAITGAPAKVYACLCGKGNETFNGRTTSYFDVITADDDTINKGGFLFQIISTSNWSTPTAATSEASTVSEDPDNVVSKSADYSVNGYQVTII